MVTDGIFKSQSSYPLVQVDRPHSEYQQNILCYPKQTTNTKRHQKKDFGSKLYRQMVGIPMGTNCASLIADLFLFCYERDFMLSLSEDNQAGVIEAFNSTSRYLDDLLNIDNNFFDSMVNRLYPSELNFI